MRDQQFRDELNKCVVVIRGRRYVPAGQQEIVTADSIRREISPKLDEINKRAAQNAMEDELIALAMAMFVSGG